MFVQKLYIGSLLEPGSNRLIDIMGADFVVNINQKQNNHWKRKQQLVQPVLKF